MQVNKKPLIIIFGLLCVLLLTYGCVSPSKSSISGKLIIYAGGIHTSSISNVSLKAFNDNKKSIEPVPEFAPDEIIVKYKPGVDPDYMAVSTAGSGYSAVKGFNNTGRGAVRVLKLNQAEKALYLTSSIRERTLMEVERLNNLPYVEYAEPNYIYRVLFVPNDEFYDQQWPLPLIKMDRVWDDVLLTDLNDLSTVTVAVIDTGIARNTTNVHPDLTTNYLDPDWFGIFIDEYDFIADILLSQDDDGREPDATDPPGINTDFHGTHVAGIIGALTNNNNGIAGVAGGNNSGVNIMPLRVLGQGGEGYSTDIAQAIRYAAKLENESLLLPTQKANIINMSLGSTANSHYIRDAIIDAYNEGVTIIAAAGNESTGTPVYPAAYPEVISVSAVGRGAERAYYSNFGPTIDIAAPGGDKSFDLDFDIPSYIDDEGIYSTIFDGTTSEFIYDYYQGTSMAAPHVAGVAALIVKALGGNPSPSTVKDKLTSTAIDLGDSEFYGAGLVNAYAAASNALGKTQGPVLYPFPKTLRLEGSTSIGSFTLKNIGNNAHITISSIIDTGKGSPGLISTISTDSGTVGTAGLQVQVSLNINRKQTGKTHLALIEILNSTGNPEYVNVIYKYIGEIYVVVLDPETNEIIEMAVTDFDRDYEYIIENLTPGRYIIGASTNRDNDNYLFDAGEAFGFFPYISSEAVLDLKPGTNLIGVDFLVVDELL